ncbi:hypothetical protein [Streptomyces sp. NPDC048256]|uniref:hypothetical protein n=1 Tax=Streptomyces sp. NPDC048256 TaxID=3154613 RepID=UPI0033C147DA
MLELERITARRNELDTLAEELAKQLAEVQAEREELVIAERVLHRPAEQDRAVAEAAAAVAPTAARVAGRAVLTSTSIPNPAHTRPVTSNFTMHSAQWCRPIRRRRAGRAQRGGVQGVVGVDG